jgi:hypothetical protein
MTSFDHVYMFVRYSILHDRETTASESEIIRFQISIGGWEGRRGKCILWWEDSARVEAAQSAPQLDLYGMDAIISEIKITFNTNTTDSVMSRNLKRKMPPVCELSSQVSRFTLC